MTTHELPNIVTLLAKKFEGEAKDENAILADDVADYLRDRRQALRDRL